MEVTGGTRRACAGCGQGIEDRYLLHALDRFWHRTCLVCSFCQRPLDDLANTFYSKEGLLLCRKDYIRLFGHAGKCNSCGGSIPADEMVMRAQGNVYHVKCFTCVTCHVQLLPGDRFNMCKGSPICELDYMEIFEMKAE